MYCRLLDRAVRELNHERILDPVETTIDIGATGIVPKAYIPSDARRMEAYRRVARAASVEELRAVERDLKDAYGDPPAPTRRLLELAELRIHANRLLIRSVAVHEQDVVHRCEDADAVRDALAEAKGTVRVLKAAPGDTSGLVEVYYRPPANYLEPETLLRVLRTRLGAAASRRAAML